MRVREFSCVLSALLISGCAADYLDKYDTVTLAAGDASRSNLMLQTPDLFNPNSQNTHIEGDGQRIAGVVQRYRGVAPTAGAVAASKVDLDCAGGKGNNPVVAGPVQITGADPNELDRDHDGIGCE